MVRKLFLLTLLCAGSLLQARRHDYYNEEGYGDIATYAAVGGAIGGAVGGTEGAVCGASLGAVAGAAVGALQRTLVYTDNKGNRYNVYTDKEGELYYKRRGKRVYFDYDEESDQLSLPSIPN